MVREIEFVRESLWGREICEANRHLVREIEFVRLSS